MEIEGRLTAEVSWSRQLSSQEPEENLWACYNDGAIAECGEAFKLCPATRLYRECIERSLPVSREAGKSRCGAA